MRASNELLQSIIKDPDNDGLRLIYADWCEENGDPEHAEFIRLQIELLLSEMPTTQVHSLPLEVRGHLGPRLRVLELCLCVMVELLSPLS